MDARVIEAAGRACERSREHFDFIEHQKDLLLELFGNIEEQVEELSTEAGGNVLDEDVSVEDIIKDLSKTVLSARDELKREIVRMFEKKEENLDWFTITFFGITNSGKSTLVESIVRNRCGKTIGEGRHNTTREVSYVVGDADMPHIRLLDTPGFEGGKQYEMLAEDEVDRTDLVVFVSSQKAPEVQEIRKVVEWVKSKNLPMVMVLNQRSQPTNVANIKDFRPTLEACNATESLLNAKMGISQPRVVPVQAQLAFFSRCFSIASDRGDLLKQKSAVEGLFGKQGIDIGQYSNYAALIEEIGRVITDEGELIKLQNLYDSLSIFIDGARQRLITHKAAFDKTKRFLGEKSSIFKREFGHRDYLGQVGSAVRDLLENKRGAFHEVKREGLAIIDDYYQNNDPEANRNLRALLDESCNHKVRNEIIPQLLREVQQLLTDRVKSFEREFSIEAKSFVNISKISELVDDVIKDYCRNRIPHYVQLAIEIIIKISEVIMYFKSKFGLVLTLVNRLFRKIFGSSVEKAKAAERMNNKMRLIARRKFEDKFDEMVEDLFVKIWHGGFDSQARQWHLGLRHLLFAIRRQLTIPVNSLYFVCKKGAALIDGTLITLAEIRELINTELYKLVIDKELSGGELQLDKVLRKPGERSYVFCQADDFETIESLKDTLASKTRDNFVQVFVWNQSREEMIRQVFESFSKGECMFERTYDRVGGMPCIVIEYRRLGSQQIPREFRRLIEDIYGTKVELEETS